MKRVVVTGAIVILVILAWSLSNPPEEERIRAVIDRSAQLVAFDGPEHPFERLARGKALGRFLDDHVTVELDGSHYPAARTYSREEAVHQVVAARSSVPYLGIVLHSVAISVSAATAEAILVAELSSIDPKTRDPYQEVSRIRVELVETDGEWRIRRVESEAPPEHSGPGHPPGGAVRSSWATRF